MLIFQAWFALSLFLLEVSSEGSNFDQFMSKFQQHDYQMKFERAEVVRFNKDYVENFKVATFKYNRTCTAFNASGTPTIDIGEEVEMVLQAYKFASNEYRLFLMRFQLNACDAFSKNVFGMAALKKCGNFTECPLRKGVAVHICSFTPDQSQFPPYIPNGRYMVEAQGLYLSKEVFLIRAYSEVWRPFTGK